MDVQANWTPTQAEFDLFAAISGDDNPIHVDPEFSARTGFGRTVSHGMLIYSKLWGMILQAYPNISQAHQKMTFPQPCYADEAIVLQVSGVVPGTITMTARRRDDDAEVFVGIAEVI